MTNKVCIDAGSVCPVPTVRSIKAGTIFTYKNGSAVYIKLEGNEGIVELTQGRRYTSPMNSEVTILNKITIEAIP